MSKSPSYVANFGSDNADFLTLNDVATLQQGRIYIFQIPATAPVNNARPILVIEDASGDAKPLQTLSGDAVQLSDLQASQWVRVLTKFK